MGKAILTPIDNPEKVVKASNCMMSDGVTDVETAINKMPQNMTGVSSNDATAIVNWLNTNNTNIPLGLCFIDFYYATGICQKTSNAVGRIRLVSYYASLDNKSSQLASGSWGAFA